MNLEGTNYYTPIIVNQTGTPVLKPASIIDNTADVKPQTPLGDSGDFFTANANKTLVPTKIAGWPTLNNVVGTTQSVVRDIAKGAEITAKGAKKTIDKSVEGVRQTYDDLKNGEFKAYKLGPLVGNDTKKAKEITDHLNFVNSGKPSTVTFSYEKSFAQKIAEMTGGDKSSMPKNLYVITADGQGNLTASQPKSGTVDNVVGVALKNSDGRFDVIRITGNTDIGLSEGANGIATFSPAMQMSSGFSTTMKTI
jgi:hypothetical protein